MDLVAHHPRLPHRRQALGGRQPAPARMVLAATTDLRGQS